MGNLGDQTNCRVLVDLATSEPFKVIEVSYDDLPQTRREFSDLFGQRYEIRPDGEAPIILRGYCKDWPIVKSWADQRYLLEKAKDEANPYSSEIRSLPRERSKEDHEWET
jgi:hypothetical protein